MKSSFRWYGDSDPVTLDMIRQIPGMRSIVSAVYDVKPGEVWPEESIKHLVDECAAHGLIFDVVESIPVTEETPTPSASISQADELYLVAQVVQKEGDMESYVAVANVIYNRLHSSSFPNTIQEVIYQKNQFSTSNLKTPSTAAMAAVQQIFVDGNLILPAEVMYFHAASRGTDRSGYTYYGTYGGNVFFYR